MPIVSPPDASNNDIQTLIKRVAELERTQRQEDVEGFIDLFDPLAVWVTGAGKRLIGRQAIAEFTRTVLPNAMADGSVNYEVENILFISTDVALTGVRQQYMDVHGKPNGAGLPSYIWRRTDDVWRIIAGQNTGVPEEKIDTNSKHSTK